MRGFGLSIFLWLLGGNVSFAQMPTLDDLMFPKSVVQDLKQFYGRQKSMTQPTGRFGKETSLEANLDVDESVELVGLRYLNDRPSFIVSQRGKYFRILFGDGLKQAHASSVLLNRLGYDLPRSWVISRLKVSIAHYSIGKILMFWNSSIEPHSWTNHFAPTPSGAVSIDHLDIKYALVENYSEESRPVRNESGDFFVALMWLQATELDGRTDLSTIDPLRYSLGHGQAYSSISALGSEFVSLKNGRIIWAVPTLFEGFRNLLQQITIQELRVLNNKMTAVSHPSLIGVFLESQVPRSVAELFAALMGNRWKTLGANLGLNGWNSWPYPSLDLTHFDWSNPEFTDFHESQTRFQVLLKRFAKEIAHKVDQAAQAAVSKLPIIELGQIETFGSKLVITPALIIRISRNYRINSTASSIAQAITVTDSMTLGLLIGVGVPGFVSKGIEIGAGGGYKRTVVNSRYAKSVEEAKNYFWLIPYELFWSKDPRRLQPGEAMGVEDSPMLAVIVNNRLFRGLYAKLQLLLIGAREWPDSIQYSKDDEGNLTVITSHGGQWTGLINLNFKYYSRYFRIPVMHSAFQKGKEWFEIFRIPAEVLNRTDEEGLAKRRQIEESLDSGKYDVLREYSIPESLYNDRHHRHIGWFLFAKAGTNNYSEGREVYSVEGQPIRDFSLFTYKNSVVSTTKSEFAKESCDFGMAYTDKISPPTSGLKIHCSFNFDPSPELEQELQNQIPNYEAVLKRWPELISSPEPFEVSWTLEVGDGLIDFLREGSVSRFLAANYSNLQSREYLLERARQEIFRPVATLDRLARMSALLRKSVHSVNLLTTLLNSGADVHFRVAIHRKGSDHAPFETQHWGQDSVQSQALQYLEDREITQHGVLFREL